MNVSLPFAFRSRSNGFSLVELLVTIGIVAILAALVIPTVSELRKAGKETQSLNQLRQIGTAMQLYAADHQQKFPPGYFYNPETRPRERTWASELLSYLGLPSNFYQIEGNPFISPTSLVPVRSGVAATFTPFTYSVHSGICPDTSTNDTRPRLSEILRPSQVILIGDGCQIANTYSTSTLSKPAEFVTRTSQVDLDQPILTGPDTDEANSRGWLRYRNRGKVAVAMVDGHAEMIPKGSVRYRNIIFYR